MMTMAPLAGLWRMTHLPGPAQSVIAFDIGLRFGGQRECGFRFKPDTHSDMKPDGIPN